MRTTGSRPVEIPAGASGDIGSMFELALAQEAAAVRVCNDGGGMRIEGLKSLGVCCFATGAIGNEAISGAVSTGDGPEIDVAAAPR